MSTGNTPTIGQSFFDCQTLSDFHNIHFSVTREWKGLIDRAQSPKGRPQTGVDIGDLNLGGDGAVLDMDLFVRIDATGAKGTYRRSSIGQVLQYRNGQVFRVHNAHVLHVARVDL